MALRDERKEQAEKHIGLVRGILSSESAQTIKSAVVYEDGECREPAIEGPRFDATVVRVERVDAAEAICKATGKACVLDFASYRYPGGGYAVGGWAQEEALCAESNLYPILDGLQDVYYKPNRQSLRGELYTDRALYLSDVVFLHGGNMLKGDVIVCAAPNKERALQNNRSEAECTMDMRNRVLQVLGIAAIQCVDTLVLGAFGCGVFRNDPTFVATCFKEWLEAHPGMFETVVFAIPGGQNYDVFCEVLAPLLTDQQKQEDQVTDRAGQTDQTDAVADASEELSEEDDAADWLPPSENGRWVFE